MKRFAIIIGILLLQLAGIVGLVSAYTADAGRADAGPRAAPVITVLYDGALGTLPGEQGFD